MDYIATVLVRVSSTKPLHSMTQQEVLDFIKKHMGGYNDNDLAKVSDVLRVIPACKQGD